MFKRYVYLSGTMDGANEDLQVCKKVKINTIKKLSNSLEKSHETNNQQKKRNFTQNLYLVFLH